MSAHTPEPWAEYGLSGGRYLAGQPGQIITDCYAPGSQRAADMARAMACVNACAGMSDPEARIAALRACEQEQGQFLVEMVRERDALRAERDAIAAELEYAIDQMLRHDFGTLSVVPRLRAALARSQS